MVPHTLHFVQFLKDFWKQGFEINIYECAISQLLNCLTNLEKARQSCYPARDIAPSHTNLEYF
jgi:hypothetical protein